MENKNLKEVNKYVKDIVSGKKIACKELKQVCQRFLDDKKNPKLVFRNKGS